MGGGSESVRRLPPTDCHEPSDSRVGCSSRRVIADLEKWPPPVLTLRGKDGNRTRLMRPLRTRFFLCSQLARGLSQFSQQMGLSPFPPNDSTPPPRNRRAGALPLTIARRSVI